MSLHTSKLLTRQTSSTEIATSTMSDEKSGPSTIKFGRSNIMDITESGWRISIKNADGTSDEVTVEPKLLEAEPNSNVSVNTYSHIQKHACLPGFKCSLTISPAFVVLETLR